MALANYTELVADLEKWLGNRTDLTVNFPSMIALAEAEFKRRLRTLDMEQLSTATAAASIALPAGFGGVRTVKIGNVELVQLAPHELDALRSDSGVAHYFAISDGQIKIRPVPASGTISMVFDRRIPALTVAAPTNWLLTAHPDLYLFGTLAQAEFFSWNDERLPLIKGRVDEIIDQILEDDQMVKYGGKTPQMRMGVTPTVSTAFTA